MTRIPATTGTVRRENLTECLWDLLENIILKTRDREGVFVIDRLNALEDSTKSVFISRILGLQTKVRTRATVRVLISSMMYPELREFFSNYDSIDDDQEREGKW